MQIEAALERAIASGELEPGDRLPPERELARRLRVSRMTLRQALRALEGRGLVSRRVGRDGGTFVEEPKLELTGLAALSDQLRSLGREAGARVLSARERQAAPAEETALGAQRVFEVVRVRSADGSPVALEIAPRRPVMLVQRTTYDDEGRVVEVSRDVFRGDRTRVVWETPIPSTDRAEKRANHGSRVSSRRAPRRAPADEEVESGR